MVIVQIIESIFEKIIASGVQLSRMNAKDIGLLREAIDHMPYIIWVHDYKGMKPMFVNRVAKEYYNYTDEYLEQHGFEVYKDLCHPDYYKDIHNAVTFWLETPREIKVEAYKARAKDGSWRWTYCAAKAFKFNENNEVENILTLVFIMDDILNESILCSTQTLLNTGFVKSNQAAYNTLTEREIEILKLIGKVLSTKEIAHSINIAASTVETHRNNLRQKLKAKNSQELVKFAILFHPEII